MTDCCQLASYENVCLATYRADLIVGTESKKGALHTFIHFEKNEFKVHLYLTPIVAVIGSHRYAPGLPWN